MWLCFFEYEVLEQNKFDEEKQTTWIDINNNEEREYEDEWIVDLQEGVNESNAELFNMNYHDYVEFCKFKINTVSTILPLYIHYIKSKTSGIAVSTTKAQKCEINLEYVKNAIMEISLPANAWSQTGNYLLELQYFNEAAIPSPEDESQAGRQTRFYRDISAVIDALKAISEILNDNSETLHDYATLNIIDMLKHGLISPTEFYNKIRLFDFSTKDSYTTSINNSKINFFNTAFPDASDRKVVMESNWKTTFEELRKHYLLDIIENPEIIWSIIDTKNTETIYFDNAPHTAKVSYKKWNSTKKEFEDQEEEVTLHVAKVVRKIVERDEDGSILYDEKNVAKTKSIDQRMLAIQADSSDGSKRTYYYTQWVWEDKSYYFNHVTSSDWKERNYRVPGRWDATIGGDSTVDFQFTGTYSDDEWSTFTETDDHIFNTTEFEAKGIDKVKVDTFPIWEMAYEFINDMLYWTAVFGWTTLDEIIWDADNLNYFGIMETLVNTDSKWQATTNKILDYIQKYFDAHPDIVTWIVYTEEIKTILAFKINERLNELVGFHQWRIKNIVKSFENAYKSIDVVEIRSNIKYCYIFKEIMSLYQTCKWNSEGPDALPKELTAEQLNNITFHIIYGTPLNSSTKIIIYNLTAYSPNFKQALARLIGGKRTDIAWDISIWYENIDLNGDWEANDDLAEIGATQLRKAVITQCTYEYSRAVLSWVLDTYPEQVTGYSWMSNSPFELDYRVPMPGSSAATYPALGWYVDLEWVGNHNMSDESVGILSDMGSLALDVALIMAAWWVARLWMRWLMMLWTRIASMWGATERAKVLYELYKEWKTIRTFMMYGEEYNNIAWMKTRFRTALAGGEVIAEWSMFTLAHSFLSQWLVDGDRKEFKHEIGSFKSYAHSIALFGILKWTSGIFSKVLQDVTKAGSTDARVAAEAFKNQSLVQFLQQPVARLIRWGIYAMQFWAEIMAMYGVDYGIGIAFDQNTIPDLDRSYVYEVSKTIIWLRLSWRLNQHLKKQYTEQKYKKVLDEVSDPKAELEFTVKQDANGNIEIYVNKKWSKNKPLLINQVAVEQVVWEWNLAKAKEYIEANSVNANKNNAWFTRVEVKENYDLNINQRTAKIKSYLEKELPWLTLSNEIIDAFADIHYQFNQQSLDAYGKPEFLNTWSSDIKVPRLTLSSIINKVRALHKLFDKLNLAKDDPKRDLIIKYLIGSALLGSGMTDLLGNSIFDPLYPKRTSKDQEKFDEEQRSTVPLETEIYNKKLEEAKKEKELYINNFWLVGLNNAELLVVFKAIFGDPTGRTSLDYYMAERNKLKPDERIQKLALWLQALMSSQPNLAIKVMRNLDLIIVDKIISTNPHIKILKSDAIGWLQKASLTIKWQTYTIYWYVNILNAISWEGIAFIQKNLGRFSPLAWWDVWFWWSFVTDKLSGPYNWWDIDVTEIINDPVIAGNPIRVRGIIDGYIATNPTFTYLRTHCKINTTDSRPTDIDRSKVDILRWEKEVVVDWEKVMISLQDVIWKSMDIWDGYKWWSLALHKAMTVNMWWDVGWRTIEVSHLLGFNGSGPAGGLVFLREPSGMTRSKLWISRESNYKIFVTGRLKSIKDLIYDPTRPIDDTKRNDNVKWIKRIAWYFRDTFNQKWLWEVERLSGKVNLNETANCIADLSTIITTLENGNIASVKDFNRTLANYNKIINNNTWTSNYTINESNITDSITQLKKIRDQIQNKLDIKIYQEVNKNTDYPVIFTTVF